MEISSLTTGQSFESLNFLSYLKFVPSAVVPLEKLPRDLYARMSISRSEAICRSAKSPHASYSFLASFPLGSLPGLPCPVCAGNPCSSWSVRGLVQYSLVSPRMEGGMCPLAGETLLALGEDLLDPSTLSFTYVGGHVSTCTLQAGDSLVLYPFCDITHVVSYLRK